MLEIGVRWWPNSFMAHTFAGKKIKNPALVENFFSQKDIYNFIFVWIVDEITFSGYFSFRVNKNLWLQNHAEPTLGKKSLQNPNFEAIYHFSVDTYHTSAVVKSFIFLNNPASSCQHFSEIKEYQPHNVIRIFLSPSLLDSTKKVMVSHSNRETRT